MDSPWDNENLVAVTERTNIRTLRYPGGTIGNYWDWDTGGLDKNVPDSLMIKWVVTNNLRESKNRYTLENLAELYKKTGITPVFMLNMLSKDLDHSIRNLKRAKAMGLPVKYVEMGNELYFNIPFPLLRFPTPEIYGETCQEWIAALKKEFPDAQFAVVGTSMTRHPRQVDWNKRVLDKCNNADAITLHSYSPSGLDGRLERRKTVPGSEGLGAQKTATRQAPKDITERQKWELELLKDQKAYTNMLTTATKTLKKIDNFHIPDDMDLWVTEFNIRDDNSVVLHSWAQTLILTEYYFKLLASNARISSMHNLVGPLFGMVHTDTLSYAHLTLNEVSSTPHTLSAGGMASKLIGDAMKGMEKAAQMDFNTAPTLTDDRNENFPSVKGWMFASGTEKRGIIVNFGFDEQILALKGSTGSVDYFAGDPASPVIGFEHLDRTSNNFQEAVRLPPHSISIVHFDHQYEK
ncbi:hypothetical protein [Maribacter sp. 2307ULW6-5]|uniref:hypothetical protein n=1 Tax=Maribacter sp. 2307ULW6-5 TaxID=3386275 RepID=UPI0039BC2D9E